MKNICTALLPKNWDTAPEPALIKNLFNILTGRFITGTARTAMEKKHLQPLEFVCRDGHSRDEIRIAPGFKKLHQNPELRVLTTELVEFGLWRYEHNYRAGANEHNLVLYKMYSYEDVCRCLNWEQALVPQIISGYKYDPGTRTLPVFVNYQKGEEIRGSIRVDKFLSRSVLSWISKNRRHPDSPDVRQILNHRSLGITLYLFIRKNHAGADNSRSDSRRETFHEFYFLAKITPVRT